MIVDMLVNIFLLWVTYITYVGEYFQAETTFNPGFSSSHLLMMALSKSLDLSGSQSLHPYSDRTVVLLSTFPALNLPLLNWKPQKPSFPPFL